MTVALSPVAPSPDMPVAPDAPDAPDAVDAELAARLSLVIGRLRRRIRLDVPGGLTPSQLSLLASLEKAGPVRITDIAALEGIAVPVTTRVVNSLAAAGLVARRRDPRDGRACVVAVTPTGAELLATVRRRTTSFLATRISRLGDAQRDALGRAIGAFDALLVD